MLGTDCPFSGKECNRACAMFNQDYGGCNINLIATSLVNERSLDSRLINIENSINEVYKAITKQ